jgi:hypothetical protein
MYFRGKGSALALFLLAEATHADAQRPVGFADGEGGPDLLRSPPVMDDVDGGSVGPVVLNGRLNKGMPRFALTGARFRTSWHSCMRVFAPRATRYLQDA